MSSRNKKGGLGYFPLVILSVLALLVATFLMVLVGKKILQHEKSQNQRIEVLEKEKSSLNETIIDKDASIEELVAHLARAEKQIEALEDAYDLNSGKIKALEEWKAEIQKKIDSGEFSSSKESKTEDEKDTKEDDKKEDKKDDKNKEESDKTEKDDKTTKSKSLYQKLVSGEDVSLLIIGDSIGEPMDDTAWVVLLQNWIQNTYKVKCRVKNVSMSANTSYAGYARTMILPEADSYDLAVICYGHNDFDYGFGDMYEFIIRAVQQRFPSCAIISILQSSQRDYTSKIRTIQSICEYYNIPVADTIKAFAESGIAYDELAPDGVHPEGTGRKIYFDTIKDIIKTKVENNETYTYAERSAMYDYWTSYDKGTYYKASDLTRVDDCTFELQKKVSGVAGVYWVKTSERCGFNFVVDGESLVDYRADWGLGFDVPFVTKISNYIKAQDYIRIEFATKASADAFEGLYISR